MIQRSWLAIIVFTPIVIIGFQNCAKKQFSEMDATNQPFASSESREEPSSGSSEIIGTGSEPTYPSIRMQIPQCRENTTCAVAVIMNRSDKNEVNFNWRTYDELALADNTGRYGRPNVHYVPNAGQVNLPAGQVRTSMSITFLSGFTKVSVPFEWSNCRYNKVVVNCSLFNITIEHLSAQ